MEDNKEGKVNYIPGNGDLIKGSVSKPQPQTPRDSISPPPAATPDTSPQTQPPASE